MRLLLLSFFSLVMIGCSTFGGYPGYYSVNAYDSNGKRLDKVNIITDGSVIHRTINGMCLAFPGEKLVIKNTKTNKELKELSPFQCKGRKKVQEALNISVPKKIIFNGDEYSLVYNGSDQDKAVYEYTTNSEKIDHWQKLITLLYQKNIVDHSPESTIDGVKSQFKKNVKHTFIAGGHGYMNVIFPPAKGYPHYEAALKKSFHNKKCKGRWMFTFAKKYPIGTDVGVIRNESDKILEKMKSDIWSPVCG